MLGVARLGDMTIGKCYHPSHIIPPTVTGSVVTASVDDFTNNRGTARLGDVVLSSCGHTGLICTCSMKTFVNNRGVARLGDLTAGHYVANIVTASTNTITS